MAGEPDGSEPGMIVWDGRTVGVSIRGGIMAARWPYGVALGFVVVALLAHVYAPFAALGYLAMFPIAAVTPYAYTRRSASRWVLVAADVVFAAGMTCVVALAPLGFAVFNSGLFAAEEVVGLLGFTAIIAAPAVGILVGLVGLTGALARPGVRVERTPVEPVGSIG